MFLFKLKVRKSYIFTILFCILLKNTSCVFLLSAFGSKATTSLDLPLIASVSLSVLKSNPIRYTYVTVPATAIVARVHLTLSAVIRASRARGGADSCVSSFYDTHAVAAVVVVVVVVYVKCGAKFSSASAETAIQTVHPDIQAIPQTRHRAKQTNKQKTLPFTPSGFNYVTDLCGQNKRITMVRMYEIELGV